MALPLIPIVTVAVASLVGVRLVRDYNQLINLRKLIALTEIQLYKEVEHQQVLSKELAELKAKFAHDILYDSLTGLPGRQVFEDRLIQTVNQSKRYQLTFGVLFLDLDGFKIINDALGHDVGDELLKEVAARLQSSIRKVDTISRFGGDEFIFILSQLSKPEAAVYVAQRLLNEISQPFKVRDHDLFITASIGIATYPADGDDSKTLLKNSDNALHQAKARGRNNYQFYREEMHTLSQRELMLHSCLQNTAIYREFLIFYQPQINVVTKKVICLQTSLIWQHPDYGLIPLQEFSRLAENTGKINELGEWMLRNVIQQFTKWRAQNFQMNRVAIGVSLKQLENPNFAYKVSQILQETNAESDSLVLEISEAMLPQKLDVIEKAFHMLKHLGVQISIKDFGAGFLSLQHLKRFPIDYLKIANSLIQDVTVNKDSEAIIKMIIALAQTMQITVVADGVESDKQKQLLKSLGCQIMEGNFFSAPLQASELTQDKMNSFIAE